MLAAAGLAACTASSRTAPPAAPPEAQAVHAIPAPPSPNPFKKPEDPQTPTVGEMKKEALRPIAGTLQRIRTEYMDPVKESQLVNGCRRALAGLVTNGEKSMTSTENDRAGINELATAITQARHEVGSDMTDEELAKACVRGMMATLDSSRYVDREEYRALQDDINTGTIGIDVDPKAPPFVVAEVIEGGPAEKHDLRPGDVIVAANGQDLASLSRQEAFERLRGVPGTAVKLKVTRPAVSGTLAITIVRERARYPSVRWTTLAAGHVYVQIARFNAATLTDLAASIKDADAATRGHPRSLILDLRNNEGGALHLSVGVAATFLQRGLMVASTEGRTPDSNLRLYALKGFYVRSGPDPLEELPAWTKTVPMVVLANGVTASGAEMVAAALQDHRRVTVIGERTQGAGLVHNLFPLDDGSALNLAVSRLRRASGALLTSGVEPDVGSAPSKAERPYPMTRIGEDPEVLAALQVLDPARR